MSRSAKGAECRRRVRAWRRGVGERGGNDGLQKRSQYDIGMRRASQFNQPGRDREVTSSLKSRLAWRREVNQSQKRPATGRFGESGIARASTNFSRQLH